MSNTKQQIEGIVRDYDTWCLCDCDECPGSYGYKRAVEAIDRLVTEAKQDVLKELVEWYEYALSVDDTSFDWYRAVKALMVSKDHKKPFSQLSNKENI